MAYPTDEQSKKRRSGRRNFFRIAGAGAAGTALFIAGCDSGEDDPVDPPDNQDPSASFTFSPQNPSTGDEVTFDATGSSDSDGTIASYEWDFGDGTSDTGSTVTKTYDETGMFDVTVTVTDDDGASTTSAAQTVTVGAMADVTLDFSVETDVLNYAYALEQLEAGFYAGVAAAIDSDGLFGDDAVTANYFVDLAEHEAIHRDFLAAALGDAGLMVQASFADFDFTDEALVLGTSQQLEDTGVSAYNGAGQYLTTDDFLTIAGKIVSVEARHASAIRSIIGGNQNFADMSDEFLVNLGSSSAFALDAAADPQTVLDVVAGTGFVSTTFSVVNT